jgi:hypothetical protein
MIYHHGSLRNAAVSLFLALVVIGLSDGIRIIWYGARVDPFRILVALVLALCVAALQRMHREHVNRNYWLLDVFNGPDSWEGRREGPGRNGRVVPWTA